jgi:hypothetical protein
MYYYRLIGITHLYQFDITFVLYAPNTPLFCGDGLNLDVFFNIFHWGVYQYDMSVIHVLFQFRYSLLFKISFVILIFLKRIFKVSLFVRFLLEIKLPKLLVVIETNWSVNIVDIDQSAFGKRKYYQARMQRTKCLFGGIVNCCFIST